MSTNANVADGLRLLARVGLSPSDVSPIGATASICGRARTGKLEPKKGCKNRGTDNSAKSSSLGCIKFFSREMDR